MPANTSPPPQDVQSPATVTSSAPAGASGAPGALDSLGIGLFDEAVYRGLLRRPGAVARELAESSGIASADVAASLAELERQGFASQAPEADGRYFPVPPDVAVELLVMKRQAELNLARLAIPGLQRESSGRLGLGGGEAVELLGAEPASQLQSYLQIHHHAEREVLIVLRPPFVVSAPEKMAAARAQARARGVHYRTILHPEAIRRPGWAEVLRPAVEAGEELRVLGELPFKMVMADRACALLPVQAEDPSGAALVVRSSSLLHALGDMFDALWARAVPIAFDASGAMTVHERGAALEPALQALLTLLAAGANDKSIAHELSMSQRTLMRRVNELYAALNARSRFQAGWLAAQRGAVARQAPADRG